jgi:hypothetical protein
MDPIMDSSAALSRGTRWGLSEGILTISKIEVESISYRGRCLCL